MTQPINNSDKEMNDGLGKLHPKEISLLKKLRNEYRYGVVEIRVEDGLPKQILLTVKRELL